MKIFMNNNECLGTILYLLFPIFVIPSKEDNQFFYHKVLIVDVTICINMTIM